MQFEWAVFSLARTQTTQHKLILPISSISQCAFVLSLKFSFFTYTHTIDTQNKAKNKFTRKQNFTQKQSRLPIFKN